MSLFLQVGNTEDWTVTSILILNTRGRKQLNFVEGNNDVWCNFMTLSFIFNLAFNYTAKHIPSNTPKKTISSLVRWDPTYCSFSAKDLKFGCMDWIEIVKFHIVYNLRYLQTKVISKNDAIHWTLCSNKSLNIPIYLNQLQAEYSNLSIHQIQRLKYIQQKNDVPLTLLLYFFKLWRIARINCFQQ